MRERLLFDMSSWLAACSSVIFARSRSERSSRAIRRRRTVGLAELEALVTQASLASEGYWPWVFAQLAFLGVAFRIWHMHAVGRRDRSFGSGRPRPSAVDG